VAIASAAGKVILLGEHAVVYGRPAIAVPVSGVRATAEVTPLLPGSGVLIVAEDINEVRRLDDPGDSEAMLALQATVRNTLQHFEVYIADQALRIVVHSRIPIARGMGSGTAVATAMVRALAEHYGRHLTSRAISDLVFQTEVILHGTPSGIDNTVVAFGKAVYFVKGRQADIFWVARPFSLLIADTGVQSSTRAAVEDVRRRWLADKASCEALFDEIGSLVVDGRQAIASGDVARLGRLMNRNQALLSELGVSSPELDRLALAALGAGAQGAKLSGGGRGGCLIALVDEGSQGVVESALRAAGACAIVATIVQ
jgi:mevalonate kinase